MRAAPGSSPPKVSVVIPTLNAGPGFGDLLGKLSAQEIGFGYEVLVIDSGSTDGTVELARRYGAAVHTIPRAEFGHGATRNLGVSISRGEYLAVKKRRLSARLDLFLRKGVQARIIAGV